jgi:hypothetical protein
MDSEGRQYGFNYNGVLVGPLIRNVQFPVGSSNVYLATLIS